MSATAIILARAGSEGLPGKNAALVAGYPCCSWTIDHAQRSRSIGSVVVSTDDPRVAAIAQSMGVIVLRRPPELATAIATIDDAARDALGQLNQLRRSEPTEPDPSDPIVILYANVPVRPADLTDRAVELLATSGCDSVQSYTTVGKVHPWWLVRLDDTGTVEPWEGDQLNHGVFRRQDLPSALVPDGGVIALTRQALMRAIPAVPPGPHAFLGADRRGITTEPGSVVDIDSPIDLIVADAVLRQTLANQTRTRAMPA